MRQPKDTDLEELLRAQAAEAQRLQRIALESVEFEEWVNKGNLVWLEEKVWKPLEAEILTTLKSLDFVPNSLQQLALMQGQLKTFETLKNRIMNHVQFGRDARARLQAIQNSTPG